MEIALLILLIIIAFATYFKKSFEGDTVDYAKKILELEKSIASKEEIIKQIQKSEELLNAKMTSFEQLKTEKTQIEERLKLVDLEKNNLRNENTKLKKEEENRNETLRKSIESTNTLQDSLKTEIARVNDERLKKELERLEI